MLQAARRRVVPVISGKLGRNSFCSFAAVSEVDLIITDEHAKPDDAAAVVRAREELGVEDRAVVVANPLPGAEQLDPAVHDEVLAAGERVDSHHVELATELVVRQSTAAP
jgi:pseudouridine-5'-phosphate glycosidase